MIKASVLQCLGAISLVSLSSYAQQSSASGGQAHSDAAGANDPTSPLAKIELRESYNPSYYAATGQGNLFEVRPVEPLAAKGWIPSTITRPDVPLASLPNGRTGLGDISVFTLFFPGTLPHMKIGFGPVFSAPTATNRYAGTGKWSVGPAFALIYTGIPKLVVGVLEQDFTSFAGEHSRTNVNNLAVQPFLVKSWSNGSFVRFDPTWTFDFAKNGTATIPLNVGLGRVLKIRGQEINPYLQPEFTVRRPRYQGFDPPRFTMRLEIDLLYPKK